MVSADEMSDAASKAKRDLERAQRASRATTALYLYPPFQELVGSLSKNRAEDVRDWSTDFLEKLKAMPLYREYVAATEGMPSPEEFRERVDGYRQLLKRHRDSGGLHGQLDDTGNIRDAAALLRNRRAAQEEERTL